MGSTKRDGGNISQLRKVPSREYLITIDDKDVQELRDLIKFLEEEKRKARFKRVKRSTENGIELAERLLHRTEREGESKEGEDNDPDPAA